jgi:putative ABC transport system permease protein
MAGLMGCVLAMAAAAALSHFVFKTPPVFPAWELLMAALAVPSLTLAVGLMASRGISDSPPLAILRNEG